MAEAADRHAAVHIVYIDAKPLPLGDAIRPDMTPSGALPATSLWSMISVAGSR